MNPAMQNPRRKPTIMVMNCMVSRSFFVAKYVIFKFKPFLIGEGGIPERMVLGVKRQ